MSKPRTTPRDLWSPLGRLTRWRLSLAVAATTAAGALLQDPAGSGTTLLLATGGVALLAAAGSAGNQLQERDLDARMLRTRERPLPSGRLAPATAAAIALLLLAVGSSLLLACGWRPALLGLAALGCYNGLYTPLKRRTPLALLPGALCGALPPLIGWSAAGGAVGDYRILLVAALLYLWQLPHFWWLADRHAADYRRAGLPVLQDCLPPPLVRLARFAWTLALAALTLLLPLFGLLQSPLSRLLLAGAPLVLIASALLPLGRFPATGRRPPLADLCLVLLLLLLLGERLLGPGTTSALTGLWPAPGGLPG